MEKFILSEAALNQKIRIKIRSHILPCCELERTAKSLTARVRNVELLAEPYLTGGGGPGPKGQTRAGRGVKADNR